MFKAIIFDFGDTLIQEEKAQQGTIETVPGAFTVLQQLAQTCRLALISNVRPTTTRERVKKVLKHVNLLNFFEAIIVSSDVGYQKPDPRIFQIALHQLDIVASEAMMVGNRISTDIVGGNQVGMTTVLFKWNDRYPEAITQDNEKPDYIIDALPQLLALLQDSFGKKQEK